MLTDPLSGLTASQMPRPQSESLARCPIIPTTHGNEDENPICTQRGNLVTGKIVRKCGIKAQPHGMETRHVEKNEWLRMGYVSKACALFIKCRGSQYKKAERKKEKKNSQKKYSTPKGHRATQTLLKMPQVIQSQTKMCCLSPCRPASNAPCSQMTKTLRRAAVNIK
jgi:hypothetical protein